MGKPTGRVVVVGVGNELRGDDAVGLAVVRALRSRLPPGVETVEAHGEMGELLDAWDDADLAVVVDAVSAGLVPGTVSVAEADTLLLEGSLRASGTHSLGVAEAVALGRTLGRLPARLVLVGVEGRSFGLEAPMSESVAVAVEAAAARVLALLSSLRDTVPTGPGGSGGSALLPLAPAAHTERASTTRKCWP
jgi:hydrogenase maturation protease